MGYASLTLKTIGINVLRNYWLNGVFVRRQLITSPSTYLVASRSIWFPRLIFDANWWGEKER